MDERDALMVVLDAKNVRIGRLTDDVMRLTKAVEFRDARIAELLEYKAMYEGLCK